MGYFEILKCRCIISHLYITEYDFQFTLIKLLNVRNLKIMAWSYMNYLI